MARIARSSRARFRALPVSHTRVTAAPAPSIVNRAVYACGACGQYIGSCFHAPVNMRWMPASDAVALRKHPVAALPAREGTGTLTVPNPGSVDLDRAFHEPDGHHLNGGGGYQR